MQKTMDLDGRNAADIAGGAAVRADAEGNWGVLGLTALAVLLAFAAGRSGLYTPEDSIGYQLGLVGGSLMLALLLYPLRKRLPFARRWGSMKPWFSFHMLLGVLGPALVLAHTTFEVNSLNAAVALFSMLLVAGSGLIGRFVYVKIHRGLNGERMAFAEIQTRAGLIAEDVRSSLVYAPKVAERLKRFEHYATRPMGSTVARVFRFFALFPFSVLLWLHSHWTLPGSMRRAAKQRGWDSAKRRRRTMQTRRVVHRYLKTLVRLAHFKVYERLFSWWHVLHVPLFVLLVVSAGYHVLAVHMY